MLEGLQAFPALETLGMRRGKARFSERASDEIM
jgi:hypothetical protein